MGLTCNCYTSPRYSFACANATYYIASASKVKIYSNVPITFSRGTIPNVSLPVPHETSGATRNPSPSSRTTFFKNTPSPRGLRKTTYLPARGRSHALAQYPFPETKRGHMLSPDTFTRKSARLKKLVGNECIRIVSRRVVLRLIEHLRNRIHRLVQLERRFQVAVLLRF